LRVGDRISLSRLVNKNGDSGMNKRQTLLALAALPFLAGAVNAQDLPARISIATEGAYPPWNFTNADGTLAGYEIELIDILCARMKVECEVVSQEWNGIIPGLTAGKYDAIIASMGVTEQRLAVVAFSAPYARAPNGFLTTGENALADLPQSGISFSLADAPAEAEAALATLTAQLAGKAIGVQTGSTAASFAAEYFVGLDLREYPSFEQLGLELTAGRLDLAIANVTAFKAVIDANTPGALVLTGPTFSGGVLGLGTTNVALRQGEDALRDAFDAAIAEINADGTNTALTEKWFGVDISIHP
jgi:octopine/nopaline transport system substrate-binding protein